MTSISQPGRSGAAKRPRLAHGTAGHRLQLHRLGAPPNTSRHHDLLKQVRRQLLTREHRRLGRRATFFGLLGILLAVLLGLSCYIFGPMRHARLGLIDDHEILRFLGDDANITLTDIPNVLIDDTEVGQWGHSSRLRPLYYLFRIIEAAVHGDNASQLYLTRMVLVALTAIGIAALVLRIVLTRQAGRFHVVLSFVLATLAGILVITMPAWQDIASRLGPSELYVGIGLALFAIGSYEVWSGPRRAPGWVFLFLGCMVTVGSKENGLLLLPPFLLLYLMRFPQSTHRALIGALGAVTVFFGGYIALGVALGASTNDGDVYGNGRTLGPFVEALVHDPYLYAVLLCFIVALVCDVFLSRNKSAAETTGRFGAVRNVLERWPRATACSVTMYLVVGEAFFYQTAMFGGDFRPLRYAFVTQLATLVACIIAFTGLVQLGIRRAAPRLLIVLVAVLVVTVSPARRQVDWALANYRADAVATADRSIATFNQITASARDTTLRPNAQVVLLVDAPSDYEKVFALPRFLAFYGRGVPVYMRVDISPPPDPFLVQLSEELNDMAAKGKLTSGWRITPYSGFHASKSTICLYFGATPADLKGCASSRQIG